MADDVGSYGAAKTIKEVLSGIAHNKYVLPSIQRQFVWKHGQIEELFDSLLRGYPVGTFMFWKLDVDSQNKGIIKLYEFYKDIEEDKNIDNTEYNSLASNEEVFAVIDGQQRLTALNIGLFGSYAYRKKGTWKTGNYPKRRLYLDLKSYIPESDNDPKKYNFKFLTEEESQNGSEHNWYKVGEILKIKNEKEMDEFTDKENLVGDSRRIFPTALKTPDYF